MKKHIKYLLLALFIFSFSSVALAEGEDYKGFTTSKLVIRDLEGNQVGLIGKGEEVTGKIEGNWLHFSRNDQEVKIYKPYVRSEKSCLPTRQTLGTYLLRRVTLFTLKRQDHTYQ